jgi:hypothetical protein
MFNWTNLVASVCSGAGGGLIVVWGLSRWLGDLWKAKILEQIRQSNSEELETLRSTMQASVDKANRLLDADISKAILVTRTHFETEFSAYKEIFAALSDVKNSLHATRPVFVIADENDRVRDEKNLNDRLNKLIATHNLAVVVSENLRPFYQDEIFRALQKCSEASKYEIFQVRTGGHDCFSAEWFEEGRKMQQAFMAGYDEVAGLIRERLASLGVFPG